MYRYETHLHTCQGSRCGVSTGREHARYYHDLGYQGIIITDHFLGGNTAIDRSKPWKEQMKQFCSGYEDALDEGIRLGLDVFFGWEQTFEGDDYLIYGLSPQWLMEHPESARWNRREQLAEVHRYGGCVVQAHPFRQCGYLHQILLGLTHVDAVEVFNAGNLPVCDACAIRYALENHLMMTSGSDNHCSRPEQTFMGIAVDEPFQSVQDYVRLILERKPVQLLGNSRRFDFQPEEDVYLPCFVIDENEQHVPYHRAWMPAKS